MQRCLMFPRGASVANSAPELSVSPARPSPTTSVFRARSFVNHAAVDVYDA